MHKYIHKVQYYETDQMAIVHHSNYIRWFEEARVDFLDRIGFGYHETEKMGIMSPVTAVNCEFRSMTRFGESVQIGIRVKEFNGVRLKISYQIEDVESGELRAVGESSHCFLSETRRPVSVKKVCPEYYEAINDYFKKEIKTI